MALRRSEALDDAGLALDDIDGVKMSEHDIFEIDRCVRSGWRTCASSTKCRTAGAPPAAPSRARWPP
jgi:hypothetical protein